MLGALVAAVTPTRATDRQDGIARPVVVFAAASLKTALDQIIAGWHARGGARVVVSYAGSSALARQIEQGAPADIFISASTQWMDAVEKNQAIQPATGRDLLTNRLVLIAHGTQARHIGLDGNLNLAGLLGRQRLAMALVDSVPAGIYGKAALTSLGLWEQVAPKVAQTDNVRAALALVARGEAPLGIVYATDAAASDNVTVVATFPATSHPTITYPVALTTASRNSGARAVLDHLVSATARTMFERAGFTARP